MTRDQFKTRVESALDEALILESENSPSKEITTLLGRMRSLVMRGGKRARPLLLFETYRAYGGRSYTPLIDLAVSLEMHHQFLLMHDDVIDNDTVRYNGPNIIGYYRKDADSKLAISADSMGVLAGDLIFSFANKSLINSTGLHESQKLRLLRLIHETNIGVGYGQLLDSFNIDSDASHFDVQNLIKIHSLKSARYSTYLPMLCAAELLQLPAAERKLLEAFALPFGILFQLVDDYSDYFTNLSAFNNRPKYRDYRQGKVTYPLYQGFQLANGNDHVFLMNHLADKNLSEKNMKRVVAILEKSGAKKVSLEFLEQYFERSHRALDSLSLTLEMRKPLSLLVDSYQVEKM